MLKAIEKSLASSHGPTFYGVFQGLLVAVVYLLLKASGERGGLPEFAIAATLVALLHILGRPKATLSAFRSKKLLARGALFGASQIFACLALARGDASTAVISGTLGGILGVVLGNLILKEKLAPYKYGALSISFIGACMNPAMLSVTLLAVISGGIKGCGSVLTRNLMVMKVSPYQTVGVTCAVAAVIAVPSNILLGVSFGAADINLTYVALLSGAIVLIQYGVCFLYTISDTQRASAYTLTRIPFVLMMEWVVFDHVPPALRALSAAVVIAGALLLTWLDMRGRKAAVASVANAPNLGARL